MSVERAQQEINSAAFSEWKAYSFVEPFGDDAHNIRHATLCMILDNFIHGFGGKTYKGKPEDYVYKYRTETKTAPKAEQTPDEMWKAMTEFAAMHNKRFKKKCQ